MISLIKKISIINKYCEKSAIFSAVLGFTSVKLFIKIEMMNLKQKISIKQDLYITSKKK